MANTVKRRPLPALVSLLALLLLTGLVWWRVLHRGGGTDASASPCPSTSTSRTALPPPSAIVLRILNSTSRTGIGGKVRKQLIDDGFQVPALAGNDRAAVRNKLKVNAEIRYGSIGRTSARVVHYYFPGARLVHTTTKSGTVVVSLGTKYRAVAAPAAVQRAMRAAKVVLATDAPAPQPSASSSASC